MLILVQVLVILLSDITSSHGTVDWFFFVLTANELAAQHSNNWLRNPPTSPAPPV